MFHQAFLRLTVILFSVYALAENPVNPKIVLTTPAEQIEYFGGAGKYKSEGVFHTQQALAEIEANGGSAKLLTYPNPEGAQHLYPESVLKMVGPYLLLEKMPRHNPDSNLPMINDASYNKIVREKIEADGLRLFITGHLGGPLGAAVLSDKTPFNYFFSDLNVPIIVAPIDMSMDVFIHEYHHLKQRQAKEMDAIERKIFASLDRIKGEKFPETAENLPNYAYLAMQEVPACIEQLLYIELMTGPHRTAIVTHSPKVDPNTGAPLEEISSKTVFFRKKIIPLAEAKKIAREKSMKYLNHLYGRVEQALAALKQEGSVRALHEFCGLMKGSIPSGSMGSPDQFLKSCPNE